MTIIELNEEQVEIIEDGLSAYDDGFIQTKLDGTIQLGILENGELIAGLDACTTAFRILYVSTVFVKESHRRKGYGKALIRFVADTYRGKFQILQVGTGDSPLTVPFYEKCGFVRSHYIKNFFTDNYDHPIFECGVQLVDMVYLRQML